MRDNCKFIFIIAFIMFVIPFTASAYLIKETGPAVNTFSLAEPPVCIVTKHFYYVDENDNRIEAQPATTENVYCDTNYSLNSNLLNLDYSSVKWYIGNTELSGTSYYVSNNVTIDEVYYLNRYTITYNLDGGTVNSNPTIYTEKTGTITINNPSKPNYSFLGWTWDGQTTPVLNLTFNSTDKENKVFTANWQLLPSYNLESGGTFSTHIPATATQVIFGKSSDYPDVVSSVSGTRVGSTTNDLIYRYTVGTTVYILSDGVIKFNASSNNMFNGKNNLTSITFANIDTSAATTMTRMFLDCDGLVELDLSLFDTSNVRTMDYMFANTRGAHALTTIYVSDSWNVSNVSNSANIFKNAISLVGGNGTVYDANHYGLDYAHIDETGNPGYLTRKS